MSKCSYPVPMYRTSDDTLLHEDRKGLGISELYRPCGYCVFCRLTRAESWAVRMTQHAKMYSETSFLTLTYADDQIPSAGSLVYEDVTLFIKKLRKVLSKTPYKNGISYYRAGEYGSQLGRPHYHLILFGFDFSYQLRYKGVVNQKTIEAKKDNRQYYKSTFLNDLWDKGFADIGDVDYATCMYVSKYVLKKVYGPQATDHYQRLNEYGEYVQIEPEKASMSNGIGKSFIEKFWSDLYPHDSAIVNGKRYRVPRYYDEWLKKTDPLLLEQVKQLREESMEDSQPTLRERVTSHKVQLLRQQNFSRDGHAPDLPHDDFLQSYYHAEINHFHEMEKQQRKTRV